MMSTPPPLTLTDALKKSFIFFFKMALATTIIQKILDSIPIDLNSYNMLSHSSMYFLPYFILYFPLCEVLFRLKNSKYLQSRRFKHKAIVIPDHFKMDSEDWKEEVINGLIFLVQSLIYFWIIRIEKHSGNLLLNFLWSFYVTWNDDFFFYLSHRLMHHNLFYKQVHKMHHEIINTNAYVSEFLTNVDSIIQTTVNVLPFLIWGCDMNQLIAWVIVGILYNIESHSTMSLFFTTGHHVYHHIYFNKNYGITYYLDDIFGTLIDKGREERLSEAEKSELIESDQAGMD